jgi:hypothetical protein
LILPFKVILYPDTKDFGFVNIIKVVRSNFQVCILWYVFTKINLKCLAFLSIKIETISGSSVREVV